MISDFGKLNTFMKLVNSFYFSFFVSSNNRVKEIIQDLLDLTVPRRHSLVSARLDLVFYLLRSLL